MMKRNVAALFDKLAANVHLGEIRAENPEVMHGRDERRRFVALCPAEGCDHAVVAHVEPYGWALLVDHMNDSHNRGKAGH